MERVDKILTGLSIPVNTSPGNMPISSVASDVCPLCRGAGYLRMEAPVGSPNFGRLFPCQCKMPELLERSSARMDRRFTNLEAFGDKTFATFDHSLAGVYDPFMSCLKYASNPTGWLVLMGNYGSGKTHLAAAIANAAVERGLQTYFAIAPDLLDHLRAAYAPNSETSYDDRFDAVRTVALLVVDDLGTENTTPWAREKLYQIFNHRYNHQFPTVVTSNVKLEEIEPRIRSRLCDQQLCAHIFIPADDFRQRGAGPRGRDDARGPIRPLNGRRPTRT